MTPVFSWPLPSCGWKINILLEDTSIITGIET